MITRFNPLKQPRQLVLPSTTTFSSSSLPKPTPRIRPPTATSGSDLEPWQSVESLEKRHGWLLAGTRISLEGFAASSERHDGRRLPVSWRGAATLAMNGLKDGEGGEAYVGEKLSQRGQKLALDEKVEGRIKQRRRERGLRWEGQKREEARRRERQENGEATDELEHSLADCSSPGRITSPLQPPGDPPPNGQQWPRLLRTEELDHLIATNTLPTTRGDAMRLLHNLPVSATPEHMYRLYRMMSDLNLLADVGPCAALLQAAHQRDQPSVALRLFRLFFKAMRESDRPFKSFVTFIEGPVRSLAHQGKWSLLIKFTRTAIAHRFVSDDILRFHMRAQAEARDFVGVVKTFSLFAQAGLEPSDAALDEVVCAHLKNGNLHQAHEILNKKAERQFSITERTVMAITDGFRHLSGNQEMEDKILKHHSLKDLRQGRALVQNVKVLNRLFSVRAERALSPALWMLQFYDLSTVPRPELIKALAGDQDSFSLIGSRQLWCPTPNRATYAILMSLALSRGRNSLAFDFFVDSQTLRMGVDEHIVAQLVRAVGVREGSAVANKFVFDLYVGPTSIPGLKEATAISFKPTVVVFEALLPATLRANGLRGASRLLEAITALTGKKVEATDGIVSALLEHLTEERHESIETSAKFIVMIQALTRGRSKPTLQHLNALIRSTWLRRRFMNQRRKDHIMQRSSPSTSTFSRPTSHPPWITRIRTSLADRGIVDNHETVEELLRSGIFSDPSAMWDYVEENIIERGHRPTRHHIASIMRVHLKQRDLEGAWETLKRGRELGVSNHVSFYSMLISGSARLGRQDDVPSIWSLVRREGLEPDRGLFAALAFAYARSKRPDKVEEIIRVASQSLDVDLSMDAVFVLLQFRALVSVGRVFDAQVLARTKLKEGMIPDLGVKKVLKRSRRWTNRKANLPASWRSQSFVAARRYGISNLKRVRSVLEQSPRNSSMKELDRVQKHLDLIPRDESKVFFVAKK
ncbi:hypothetical protein T439DRAFT_329638 [Meredithblackwellia eburnea MCA 4105]